MRSSLNPIKPKYKRFGIIIISIIISSIGLWLILDSFEKNIVFFYTPTELTKGSYNKVVRVGGMVKQDSIKKYNDELMIEFVITDMQTDLTVRYKGITPSLFREKQGVVAKGSMLNSVFIAEEILAKHDENYMPKEALADYYKNN